jgi:hypothetical protein
MDLFYCNDVGLIKFFPFVARQKIFQDEAQAGGQKGRGSGGRNFCTTAVSG